jgi:hypothetical protein
VTGPGSSSGGRRTGTQMIEFGLRLTLRGGREAIVRLTLTAIAVALGTWLLLTAIAGINAVNAQNLREAWLNSAPGPVARHQESAPSGGQGRWAGQPLLWKLQPDFYRGQLMGRLDVAATGPHSPVPPGIPHLPGPGQFYASPAMIKLLNAAPARELADRYPGHLTGAIAASALPAPNTLLIIIGHSVSYMHQQSGAFKITAIQMVPPNGCYGPQCAISVGIGANGMDLILSTVGVGLLLPVLIFIGASTRLSAARREQRYAAMRLTGATPRQITTIASVESAVAAAIGVGVGFALFFALRPLIASFPFTGAPFFTSDMSLNLLDIAAIVIGVPAAAAVIARIALQRVQISPLGVSRRVKPQPPRAWRVIPLLAGMAELAVFIVVGKQKTSADEVLAITPGFVMLVMGLVIAGPWLTMVGARLLAGRARRPGSLIAARRLADNPQLGFRTISGLTLALFVLTVVISVITSINAHQAPPGGVIGNDIVTDQISGPGSGPARAVPEPVLARLAGIRGVQTIMLVHADPLGTKLSFGSFGTEPASLVPCGQLARIPVLGKCAPGGAVASFPPEVYSLDIERSTGQSGKVWPTVPMTTQRVAAIGVQTIVVATNGSPTAIERARTYLIDSFPSGGIPVTQTEEFFNSDVTKWQRFAYVLIFASLAIGGCTLAVTVICSLSERKRPFSLLRLTGVQLRMLQQVVLLETSVPLVLSALVAAGAGLLAAYLFLNSQLGFALRWPGATFYVIVAAGLAASVLLIVGTLPLLRRMTGPEVARNE